MLATRRISRAALAAAIDRAGHSDTAETAIDLDRDGDYCVAIELTSEAALFPIIAAAGETLSPETALDLAKIVDFDHVGYRVIARFPGFAAAEPVDGRGSVNKGVDGYAAVNRAGRALEIEDEATAWDFAATGA